MIGTCVQDNETGKKWFIEGYADGFVKIRSGMERWAFPQYWFGRRFRVIAKVVAA